MSTFGARRTARRSYGARQFLAICLGLKDSRRLHNGLAVACAIVVVIDLASWIIAPAASMTDLGLAAIHTHKNTLGAVMLLTGLICAPYTLSQPGLMGRMFWGAITIASVVLLVASKSKTSLGILRRNDIGGSTI